MKKLPVIEARVFCPRQGREIDCERCYVCTWLAGVSAKDGSITCVKPGVKLPSFPRSENPHLRTAA